MNKQRILHSPVNIAGQASTLSRAQRKMGFESDVLCYHGNNKFQFPCDIDLRMEGKWTLIHTIKSLMRIARCIWYYDLFHFHFGDSLLPKNRDLPLLKLLGKKTLMHYWGSDIIEYGRIGNYSRLEGKHVQEELLKCNDQDKKRHNRWIEKRVNATIVGDYSLLPYSPDSIVVRQAIDIDSHPYLGAKWSGGKVRIVHAPTHRALKGTDKILNAVEQLKAEGHEIEFILVERVSHQQAIEIYQSADIVVDDVLMGPYGILAIECMCIGKPVLAFIHEKFVDYYQDLPIVNTPPEKIYYNLKELIENPHLREKLGEMGRIYVEKNHDSRLVAEHIQTIYDKL